MNKFVAWDSYWVDVFVLVACWAAAMNIPVMEKSKNWFKKKKNPGRIYNTSTPFPMSKTSSPWRDWQHWKENLLPIFVAQTVGWTIRARQASIGTRPLQQVIPRLCFATNPVCFHRYLSEVTDGHFRNCCLCYLSLTAPSSPLHSVF